MQNCSVQQGLFASLGLDLGARIHHHHNRERELEAVTEGWRRQARGQGAWRKLPAVESARVVWCGRVRKPAETYAS
eukprot:scaffold12980_cov27-Tisochrysis_lutea.AAC.1